MIAIGIGANSRAEQHDFAMALDSARRDAGGADIVAAFEAAAFAPQAQEAARRASLSYCAVTLDAMRARNDDCQTRSERALSLFRVASMAEAAALAGAGSGSRLIFPRRIIGNVTIAAAQSADELERGA
ncbi:MAG: cobalamin biosynthesis protein [Proteobacteria bacterium]|nr:cobalamin biosynthesis protein [Pseudomonadota bacterium]